MIDHLGLHGIGRLQDLFNLSWSLDRLQREWRKAIIIPIIKPGKDTSSPESFRPIAALFINSWRDLSLLIYSTICILTICFQGNIAQSIR
ncbi:hypothetical protein TNCT_502511 [Trichonephila clavata]|uniref:Uncharacterized protein n=1 Tax=Trichonephila clavata TaxID=2740835 RepID=A0A8X6K9Y8_TRICU|nr:hypothetical protein TNCT_502511 [Trichonephila clavata]